MFTRLLLLKLRAKLVASPDFRERMRRRAAENKQAKVYLPSVSISQRQAKIEVKKKQHDASLENSRPRTFTAADLANKSAESTPQVSFIAIISLTSLSYLLVST